MIINWIHSWPRHCEITEYRATSSVLGPLFKSHNTQKKYKVHIKPKYQIPLSILILLFLLFTIKDLLLALFPLFLCRSVHYHRSQFQHNVYLKVTGMLIIFLGCFHPIWMATFSNIHTKWYKPQNVIQNIWETKVAAKSKWIASVANGVRCKWNVVKLEADTIHHFNRPYPWHHASECGWIPHSWSCSSCQLVLPGKAHQLPHLWTCLP